MRVGVTCFKRSSWWLLTVYFSVWGSTDGREGGVTREALEGSLVKWEGVWVTVPLTGGAGPGLRVISYGEFRVTCEVMGRALTERERGLETGSLHGKAGTLRVGVAGVPGEDVEVERAAALHDRTALCRRAALSA